MGIGTCPLFPLSGQIAVQQVSAVDNLLDQVERNIVVLVGGLETNPRITLLDVIQAAGQVDSDGPDAA
jgi:hypothetical protein